MALVGPSLHTVPLAQGADVIHGYIQGRHSAQHTHLAPGQCPLWLAGATAGPVAPRGLFIIPGTEQTASVLLN